MALISIQQIADFEWLAEYENKGKLPSLIIESSDLAIKAETLEGTITFWNQGAERIYGFTSAEVIGKNYNFLIPPDQPDEFAEVLKRIGEGHVVPHYETRRIRKDAAVINVSHSVSPIKNEKGKIIGVATLSRDITAFILANNKKLAFQDKEKGKRADELIIANKELVFQNEEKEKRAAELFIANKELAFQNAEKEKIAAELFIANKELVFQNEEKEKRAYELIIANKELIFQNEEKEKRADELIIANKELVFQNKEKEKRATELIVANKELAFQNEEKEKRAAELAIADIELDFQNVEKDKRVIENKELEAFSNLQKKASQYARSLIEACTDPLVTISPEGKITDVNEASAKVTGETREKLTGTDFSDYFTEPEKAREGYKQVFEKGVVADYPLTIRHKNGQLTDVLYNASVYKDDEGKVLGVFAAARDISAIKLASQYARSIIEASRDPLFAISTEGKIIDVNEATLNATEQTRSNIIGADFYKFVTEPEHAKIAYQQIFEKGFITDYPLTIKDGVYTNVLCNGSVYKDDRGNILGAVIVARDITEQKKIATELIEAKVFAEKATAIAEEATRKAESATLIAEDAVKAKQQFLSNMSHEIRTPMNAIIGFTKVVLKTTLTAKQKEYLQAIKMSGDALIVLINDILDLAKVDAGKMTFEQIPFKMDLSISAMLHLFETKIQEKNLLLIKEYDGRIPEVLLGDPVRLHQIILNLVSNAVKFTSKGIITVSIKLLEEIGEDVVVEFTISDTGIGISQNKLETIFDNFQQASSGTSRLYGGTGLGLAIVKQLVEPQGGSINVKSILDKGSTFSFILPFKKTNAVATLEAEITEESPPIKNIKVLVVEDIALNQLLMKTLLDDFGFEYDIANNGKIAIEKLKTDNHDIILMDLQMPEMNGFEATEYIRTKMNSSIPIIALTADVTTVDLAKCKAVGMNDYIAKPVDERVLFKKILGLVRKPIPNIGYVHNLSNISSCINLEYLNRRTKSDPALMMEMISLYLEQTPPLIKSMKDSLLNKDWYILQATVHKMIPSFSIVGINHDFEIMAKKIQEFAIMQERSTGIEEMVSQLENVLTQACDELQKEFNSIKAANQ